MKQYISLLENVISNGVQKEDRTGTGTRSIFGWQMRFDLSKGFPLLTTKKLHFKSIAYELLWFIRGDTNIEYLNKNSKSNIFNCGYEKGYSVLEIVKIFKKMKKNVVINFMQRRTGDVGQVYSNTNKFKKTFKWKPKYNDIRKILNSSIKWEKKLNHL